MYFAKKMTNLSLPEIAKKFGGKDHTTIMHGIKKIESLMQNDVEVSREYQGHFQTLYGLTNDLRRNVYAVYFMMRSFFDLLRLL